MISATEGDRVVVVSCDTHVAPSLRDHLRPYCPSELLDEFDAFTTNVDRQFQAILERRRGDSQGADEATWAPILRNAQGRGSFDPDVRLADFDRDGVAAGIIFHGAANEGGTFEQLPFHTSMALSDEESLSARDRELVAAGRQIYNRWLVDFCSSAPARHVGLCQVPIWDVDASIEVIRWAADRGMRGVNFPYPQPTLPSFDDPVWDPLFATCAELEMTLTTHVGIRTVPPFVRGPAAFGVSVMEGPFVSGRGLWHMIFTGVFDRHPGLKFVIAESPGTWWINAVHEMESIFDDVARGGPALRASLRRRPVEYVHSNVFFCESFQSRMEARAAAIEGLSDSVLWGSDYPHVEGTWHYTEDDSAPSTTRLSLAHTLAELHELDIRRMAGTNAMECYALDAVELRRVADRIGPTLQELSEEPDLSAVPPEYVGLGFRLSGAMS